MLVPTTSQSHSRSPSLACSHFTSTLILLQLYEACCWAPSCLLSPLLRNHSLRDPQDSLPDYIQASVQISVLRGFCRPPYKSLHTHIHTLYPFILFYVSLHLSFITTQHHIHLFIISYSLFSPPSTRARAVLFTVGLMMPAQCLTYPEHTLNVTKLWTGKELEWTEGWWITLMQEGICWSFIQLLFRMHLPPYSRKAMTEWLPALVDRLCFTSFLQWGSKLLEIFYIWDFLFFFLLHSQFCPNA